MNKFKRSEFLGISYKKALRLSPKRVRKRLIKSCKFWEKMTGYKRDQAFMYKFEGESFWNYGINTSLF